MMVWIFYFLFVHATLVLPGYTLISKLGYFKNLAAIRLCLSYVTSILIFSLLSLLHYALNIPIIWLSIANWLILAVSIIIFIKYKFYKSLLASRLPIIFLVCISGFSLLFTSLSLGSSRNIIPDPVNQPGRNYDVLNVKILNIAGTGANDNYIPYRQAQFIVNRSDPGKDSFIDEWGVHFFQRTPLMGFIVANYFIAFQNQVPVDYSWSNTAKDVDQTYLKFQIIGQILNYLFIIPGFYLLKLFFNKKVAFLTLCFVLVNPYFLYNAFFSWPKSFVAFFVLLSWLLIMKQQKKYIILAGLVSGLAYLTHDLSVLYIGTSCIVLLCQRKFRLLITFILSCIALALPWLIASGIIYNKPSSFYLYPFSKDGAPQSSAKEIIKDFFNTPVFRLIAIRLESLYYLLSPYQLLHSEGGQLLSRRLWAFGIFSIPGSVGFGLIIPAFIGLFKRIKNKITFILFTFSPIILSVLVIGWPRGLGSLHFAQASVFLLMGLGTSILIRLKSSIWAMLAYIVSASYTIFFILYSFNGDYGQWLKSFRDCFSLVIMISVLMLGLWLARTAKSNNTTRLNRALGYECD